MLKRTTSFTIVFSLLTSSLLALPALANTLPEITFENPEYTTGNINGQQGWMKTGSFDSAVDTVASFANAIGFEFGDQSLRISNAITSGSFGDQTFSPGLTDVSGESEANKHFEASFSIGSTQSTQQSGLFLSVSPDDGQGSRMSYVGFDDQPDGIHVIFYDATNPGPLGTTSSFNPTEVGVIDRTNPHFIKFKIDFVPGPNNDVVKLYVDGKLKVTGTTWEDYYRYDPEQNGNGNIVPVTSKLLFRAAGGAAPATLGKGFLIDNVNITSNEGIDPKEGLKKIREIANQTKKNKDIKGYQRANITRPIRHALNDLKSYERRTKKGRTDSAQSSLKDYYENLNELEKAIEELLDTPELADSIDEMLELLKKIRRSSPKL